MSETPRYQMFRDYLEVVRERRLLILLVVLVFGAAALIISLSEDRVYEAEASLLFKDENVDLNPLGLFVPGQTAEQRAAIAAEKVERFEIARRARRELGTRVPAAELQERVTALPEARSNLVVVQSSWGDPEFAARLANAFATAVRDDVTKETRARYRRIASSQREGIRKLPEEGQLGALTRVGLLERIARLESGAQLARPVEIAVPAGPRDDPVSPQTERNIVVGLLLGLTFGLVAAFARDSLDRRFSRSHEISDELGLPLVGLVGLDALGRTVVAAGKRKPLSAEELEAFRILRTNVDFLNIEDPPKVILVTSALPEEGKSTVAAGLACMYASAGKRTILLECDLRRPTLAQRLNLQAAPGLTDYLTNTMSPSKILQTFTFAPAGSPNGASPPAADADSSASMVCIVAGSPASQPAELLSSPRFTHALESVRKVYDHVIVDSSPLLSVADTLELLPRVDGLLVCLRASRTTRDQARAAKTALDHFPEHPAGVVITGARPRDDQYGYHPYAYDATTFRLAERSSLMAPDRGGA